MSDSPTSLRIQDTHISREQAIYDAQDNSPRAPLTQEEHHPRPKTINKDHSRDLIIGSPSQGVRTRRNQYKPNYVSEGNDEEANVAIDNFSFVSMIEPTKIDEAMDIHKWIIAM